LCAGTLTQRKHEDAIKWEKAGKEKWGDKAQTWTPGIYEIIYRVEETMDGKIQPTIEEESPIQYENGVATY